MKFKAMGLLLLAVLGFSTVSANAADVLVPVSTAGCGWVQTQSGVSGAPTVGTIYWYNAKFQCPNGVVMANKNGYTSTSGQKGCSVYAAGSYVVQGTCDSFSVSIVTTIPDPVLPAGAACTWSASSYTGASYPGGYVYVYAPIGQCKNRNMMKYFDSYGRLLRTEYQ